MYKVLWALVVVLFYSVKGICPDEWTLYNNNCYKFGLAWPVCQTNCANLGATMLCVTDATTNAWMWSQTGGASTWIGLSDIGHIGTYMWVSGCSSTYTGAYQNQQKRWVKACLPAGKHKIFYPNMSMRANFSG